MRLDSRGLRGEGDAEMLPPIREIPYTRSDGLEKIARVVPGEFSLDAVPAEMLLVVERLSEAVNALTPVYARQQDPRTVDIVRRLADARSEAVGKTRQDIDDYLTLMVANNGIFDAFGNSFVFPGTVPRDLVMYEDILLGRAKPTPGRGLYPADMALHEFDAMDDRMRENSIVVRVEGKAISIVNEDYFSSQIIPAKRALHSASKLCAPGTLRDYIDAKLLELESGEHAKRIASDIAWIANDGAVDFIFSTALETYLDEFKGVRGNAASGVWVKNPQYTAVADRLSQLIPAWAPEVPWDRSKDRLDKLPKLRFVDVLNWTGYEDFPIVTMAESLPNDREVAAAYGAVNLVFANINKAMSSGGTSRDHARALFSSRITEQVERMSDIGLQMIAAHEIGHSIGPMVPEHDWKSAFGSDGHMLEEARAELFSMWVLPRMRDAGMISDDDVELGYYKMLQTCIKALEQKPINHSGSRNMMFNYFLKHGGVREDGARGSTTYEVDMQRMPGVVESMLGDLGNIKMRLDAPEFGRFKEACLVDERREEFKKRFASLPLGMTILLPELRNTAAGYELRYPGHYIRHSRSLTNFL